MNIKIMSTSHVKFMYVKEDDLKEFISLPLKTPYQLNKENALLCILIVLRRAIMHSIHMLPGKEKKEEFI